MKETIASNLKHYREGQHFSQESLAQKVGISCQNLNEYENAITLPNSKNLSALARALGVTLDDLLLPKSQNENTFRFRSHTSFVKDKQPQLLTQVLRMLETYNLLEKAVGIPTYAPETTSCHQLEGNEKHIQTTATRFRRSLGLGEGKISNLFEAVEAVGLKVLRIPIPIDNFFGLSACSSAEGAFVLINTYNSITIERQIFTLAHELGHLIFHRDDYQDRLLEEGTKEEEKMREKVADYFAGHLLVPQPELERLYELSYDIISLKEYFRVSYQVILKRLEQMEIIKYNQEIKKIYAIYKKKNGVSLKKSMELPPALKPEDFPENQRYQRLIWQSLEIGKISELKAAELLHITVEELRVRRQEAEVYAIR